MSLIKIKLITIGHLPADFNLKKLTKWYSSSFKIADNIENYALRCDSDGENWEFSDILIKNQLPEISDNNFLIAIVNVPIEQNWYSRRLGNNQIVFTFYQIAEILRCSNIPLENVVYRLLYAYTLLYKRAGNKIPDFGEAESFTHDETRGCLFDMNGNKIDLVYSCHTPIICEECKERLRNEKVSDTLITSVQKEIKNIKKNLYYILLDSIKKHPVIAILITSSFTLVLGIIGSLIASFLYEMIK